MPTPVTTLLVDGKKLVDAFAAELRELIPAGTEIVDAHAHVGVDADGMVGDERELQEMLDEHDIGRAFVFPLNEEDRDPAFRAPNDRVLACAEASKASIVPFARLALDGDAAAEAERCLRRGARGLKLHPRAQRFTVSDPRLDRVVALAAERPVPILIHAGPGVGPGFAADLERLVDRHAGALLIVAHAGVADMPGLTRRFAGRTDVAFDTSTWSALDVLDLLARLPPQQVLHGSDYPYGQQPSALAVARLSAHACGLDGSEVGALLGTSAARFAAGLPLERLSPARGPAELTRPLALQRVHHHATMAAALLLSRRGDALGALELAIAACAEPDSVELERIAAMLSTARALWRALRDAESDPARRAIARLAIQLLQLVDVQTLTRARTLQEA